MSGKIKCTYDDCYRHFASVEAMKKHKTKDSAHDFYCKKCDVDATNDMELLYHQITSDRHMACPICGREFKSESGRDRHVEIEHVPKQNLTCAGCQLRFDRASTLMAHIEDDECEVIRLEHFNRQKAEKQITRDAWEAATDPTAGSTVLSSVRAYTTMGNEMNLLDDDRAFVKTDWQGRPLFDEEDERNGPYVGPPNDQMSSMSMNKFPPLGPQNMSSISRNSAATEPDINTKASEEVTSPPNTAPKKAWSTANGSSHLFNNGSAASSNKQRQTSATATIADNTSVNLLDTFTDDGDDVQQPHASSSATDETTSHATWGSSFAPALPPAARAPNLDPNFPHAQVRTQVTPPIQSSLSIDRFWDTTLDVYICPAPTCGTHYRTPESFRAHLVSGAHVAGPVTCPSCFRKFKKTASLIAHCESGSRKCKVRSAYDFDRVVREVTAGLIATEGYLEDGSVRYVARKIEEW